MPEDNRDDKVGGWTIPAWAGINLHDPPHLIGNNEFQHLENTLWRGTSLVPRGGQEKFSAVQPGGAGFFLWGAYGEVMEHGGIGGIGFTDEPDGEIPPGPTLPTVFMIWS